MTKPNSEYAKKLTKKQTKEMIYVIKNTPSPNKPNNEWEKEFRKLPLSGETAEEFDQRIIDFISKILQEQREKMIGKIEKKKISLQEISEIREQGFFQDAESAEGYNETIDELVEELQILKEEK